MFPMAVEHCVCFFYISYDQCLPILSEGARESFPRTEALQGSKEGKGEAAYTVLCSCILYHELNRSPAETSKIATGSLWSHDIYKPAEITLS
jgi:hypothetical protein